MKTRYILYPLLTFLAMLLPTSCSFEEDIMEDSSIISHGDKVSFTMEVSLAGTSGVESRAFTDAKEDELANLHLVVFEQGTGGYYYYKESALAELNHTQETENGHKCWQYDVTLTYTSKPCRVHLVGNYGESLPVGFGEEGQVMGLLETQDVEGGHDVYWNFVTLPEGIDEATGSSTLSSLQHVRLVRNYVKVQLAPDATLTNGVTLASGATFKLTHYALYNEPTKGRVAPYNASATDEKFASFVNNTTGTLLAYNAMGYAGNEPSGDFLKTYQEVSNDLVLDWKTPDQAFYLYERNHTNTDKPTSLIIKGTWTEGNETTPTYYKLDFVYTKDGETVYYNLLRNFVYKMNVTGVSGPGFSTAKDAVLQPAANNIAASAIAENYTNVSDGTGQLFVSTTYVLFSKNDMSVDLYYKYVPDIKSPGTSSNGYKYYGENKTASVTITATAEQETAATDPKTYSVLKERSIADKDETSVEYGGWRKMTLKNNNLYPGEAPTQNIIFVAGGLQRTVKLVLRDYGALGVATTNVLPVAKSPLKVTITIPQGIDQSLFPLRLFISSPNNTIYPDYGKKMPAESKNGKYGFIREVTYDEYRASNVITCDFLTNRAITSATDANVNDRTVIVENEYLTQRTSIFGVGSGVVLDSSVPVTIQRINGRYPQNIFKDGNNDGTEQEVTVSIKNGAKIGTISINKSNVTSSLALITGNNGLSANSELVFEFTDKYWKGGNSWETITYRATSSLSNISNGLNFTPVSDYTPIPSLSTPQNKKVSVPTNDHWNTSYYPERIQNGGTESVKVTLNGEVVGYITINGNTVTEGTLYNTATFKDTDTLVFTFSDRYCTGVQWVGMSWTQTWSDEEVTYTATCTVSQLKSANTTLSFTRQQ